LHAVKLFDSIFNFFNLAQQCPPRVLRARWQVVSQAFQLLSLLVELAAVKNFQERKVAMFPVSVLGAMIFS
jgi:hypothetical protein